MPYNFLVAIWRGQGHIGPALAAAQQLRHRGHGVRFIAHQEARAAIEESGYGFVHWRRTSRAIPLAPNGDFLQQAYDQFLFGPAAARAADTRDELDRAPTDAVLADIGLV